MLQSTPPEHFVRRYPAVTPLVKVHGSTILLHASFAGGAVRPAPLTESCAGPRRLLLAGRLDDMQLPCDHYVS